LKLHKKMDCSILIVGPTGSGKSTLLNYLAGDNELFKVGESYKPITITLEKKETLLRNSGIKTILIDTPGSFSAFDNIVEYYKNFKTTLNKIAKTQQFVFLTFNGATFANSRFMKDDVKNLTLVQSLLGKECWKNIYIVVTKMNKLDENDTQRTKMEFPDALRLVLENLINDENINMPISALDCIKRIIYIDNKPKNLLKEIKENINLGSFEIQSSNWEEAEIKKIGGYSEEFYIKLFEAIAAALPYMAAVTNAIYNQTK